MSFSQQLLSVVRVIILSGYLVGSRTREEKAGNHRNNHFWKCHRKCTLRVVSGSARSAIKQHDQHGQHDQIIILKENHQIFIHDIGKRKKVNEELNLKSLSYYEGLNSNDLQYRASSILSQCRSAASKQTQMGNESMSYVVTIESLVSNRNHKVVEIVAPLYFE